MVICEKCEGKNVEVLVWEDMNTKKIVRHEEIKGRENFWCRDCKEHIFPKHKPLNTETNE